MFLTGESPEAGTKWQRAGPPKGQAHNAANSLQRGVNLSGKADREGSTGTI